MVRSEIKRNGRRLAKELRVIALYWKPVYRFIRLKFHKNNEDAKDLTQGFFAAALQRDFFCALRSRQSVVSDVSPDPRTQSVSASPPPGGGDVPEPERRPPQTAGT